MLNHIKHGLRIHFVKLKISLVLFWVDKGFEGKIFLHNSGKVRSTSPYVPWKLIWYAGFRTEKEARNFELYLKTGSGKAFAYKRLVPEALKKDYVDGRIPKGLTEL